MEEVELRPRNIIFPKAGFLSEQEQVVYEQALEIYSGKARDALNISREGSNLFKILLLNQLGITTLTIPELDLIAENSPDFLKGHYEEGREIILRSAHDSHKHNNYLAEDLARQLKLKNFKNPFIVRGLRIKQDNQSEYGLSLESTAETEILEAPDFNHRNNHRKFSRINLDYSVEFDNAAKRILYTRDSGLSRLYVDWYLVLGSDCDSLALSSSAGRVVVLKRTSEAGSQKILEYKIKIADERKEYLSKLKSLREVIDKELQNN